MSNLFVQEEYVNATKGYRIGDSTPQESRFETPSEVYKFSLKEFGRCMGKVYIGEGKHIGWIFQKRVKYEDCNEYYLQETWITIHKGKPVKTIEYDYVDMP